MLLWLDSVRASLFVSIVLGKFSTTERSRKNGASAPQTPAQIQWLSLFCHLSSICLSVHAVISHVSLLNHFKANCRQHPLSTPKVSAHIFEKMREFSYVATIPLLHLTKNDFHYILGNNIPNSHPYSGIFYSCVFLP